MCYRIRSFLHFAASRLVVPGAWQEEEIGDDEFGLEVLNAQADSTEVGHCKQLETHG